MSIQEIKELKPDEIFSLLKEYNISLTDLAKQLGVDKGLISKVINNKYTGTEDTINKVWEHIAFVLQHKEDLNPIVYNDAPLYTKLLNFAIKNAKFNDDETEKFIKFKRVLTSYIENNK